MNKINNKETNKALFKNTGIIAIGQISTKVVNFFLLPLYTALLTTDEYGLVDLLSTYASFIVVIVGMQMSQAVFRFLVTCRDDKDRTKKITSTVMFTTILVCIFYTGIFILIQPFIILKCKWYLLFNVIATIFLQTTSGIARGYGKNFDYSVANFLSASVTIVLNVVFLVVFHLTVSAMLLAYIIGPALAGVYLMIKSKIYQYISIEKYSREELKVILKYSLPLVPNELSWSVIHASDRMIVSAFLSVAMNGLIAVASKFSVIYTTAFSIFNTSWTEQVVLHYKDIGGAEYINNMFDKMVAFFATIAIGIIAVMPFAFNLLVSKSFSEAYSLIPLYMIAVFFNAVIGLISSIYLIENETRQVAFSTIISAIINVVVDIVLIKQIGVYAAPVSSICGYAFVSIWRLIDVNKRHCKIRMPLMRVVQLSIMLLISLVLFFAKAIYIKCILFVLIIIMSVYVNYSFICEIGVLFLKNKSK